MKVIIAMLVIIIAKIIMLVVATIVTIIIHNKGEVPLLGCCYHIRVIEGLGVQGFHKGFP